MLQLELSKVVNFETVHPYYPLKPIFIKRRILHCHANPKTGQLYQNSKTQFLPNVGYKSLRLKFFKNIFINGCQNQG